MAINAGTHEGRSRRDREWSRSADIKQCHNVEDFRSTPPFGKSPAIQWVATVWMGVKVARTRAAQRAAVTRGRTT
jgi:hypothetical protein